MSQTTIFLWLFGILVFIFVVKRLIQWILRPISSQRQNKTSNHKFVTENDENKAFPFIHDEPKVEISLVIPAYNESSRLPTMMQKTLSFLESQSIFSSWEIVIVCDGCSDDTASVAQRYTKSLGSNKVRVLAYAKNMGKGYAVQQGILHSRGKSILMVDADGASEISHLTKLYEDFTKIQHKSLAIAVGSRAHLAQESTVKRSKIRTFFMYAFHAYISILGCKGIQDTQCGFKLFSREAALLCFGSQNLCRWLFDVEILLLAQWNYIPIVEVFIDWEEVDGSKLGVINAAFTMARDLLILRMCYLTGFWKVLSADEIQKNLQKIQTFGVS